MPIYAIYKRVADTCGNEDIYGPIRYVEADDLKDVEEIYPHGFLVGHIIKEIETVAWIKIQEQMK